MSDLEALQEEILELKKLVGVQKNCISELMRVDVKRCTLEALVRAAFETGDISWSRALHLLEIRGSEFRKLNWHYCVYQEAVDLLEEIEKTCFMNEHVTKESMDRYLKEKSSKILVKIRESRLTPSSGNG